MNSQIAYLIEWVVRKYNNNTTMEPDSEFFCYHLGTLTTLKLQDFIDHEKKKVNLWKKEQKCQKLVQRR